MPDATGGLSNGMSPFLAAETAWREALTRVPIAETNAAAAAAMEAFDEARLGQFRAWMTDAAQ